MKKSDVVLRVFVPTDQDPPKSVQPAMSAFHHPAPGLEPGLPLDGLGRLAAAADVGGETELLQGATHFVKVLSPVSSTGQALVQAHTLGLGWAGLGSGRGTGTLSTVARTSFMSWRLAPSTAKPTGMPAASSAGYV